MECKNENLVMAIEKFNSVLSIYFSSCGNNLIDKIFDVKSDNKKINSLISEIYLYIGLEFKKEGKVEENIINIYKLLRKIIRRIEYDSKKIVKVNLQKKKIIKFYGISGEDNELNNIYKLLKESKNLYDSAIINGSIGSFDYKPGWSDVDIFIMLNNSVLSNVRNLVKARYFYKKINNLIYCYNILQMHYIFFCSQLDKFIHIESTFPLAALKNGIVFSNKNNLFFNLNYLNILNKKYFFNDINKNFIQLSQKKHLTIFEKCLYIHRIYSFPLSIIQIIEQTSIYKRDSYIAIKKYENIFIGIYKFYNELNSYYFTWKIKRLKTYKIRKVLSYIFNIKYINILFINLELEIVNNIDEIYIKIKKDYEKRFIFYLKKGSEVIERVSNR